MILSTVLSFVSSMENRIHAGSLSER